MTGVPGPVALLLSAKLAGGVVMLSAALRRRGWRAVLVSELADDPNAAACDGHVVVAWDSADKTVAAAVERAGVRPAAVVNMVESLSARRAALLGHFGLADPSPGLVSLLDKAAVRSAADAAGVFPVWWTAGSLRVLAETGPGRYPVVLKPATESGASRDVHLLRSAEEWERTVAGLLAGHAEDLFVVEEFLDGEEFSIDGYVIAGRFEPVFVADKPDHDTVRLRDRGLRMSPPLRIPAETVAGFVADLQVLVSGLGLDSAWLHVEGRLGAGGRAGLIEVNPRPGGGLYPSAIRHRTGVDPIELSLSLALGTALPVAASGHDDALAIVPLDAEALGVVDCRTTAAELRRLPGVVDAYVIDGYRVSTLDKENFFAAVMVTGRDERQLRERASGALAIMDYRVSRGPFSPDLPGNPARPPR
ncbi:ATP-grasp domain-containing protein [Amycolatopsis sp. NBC_01480]|uniref:ATP-grasp domain-containing protein n=1 Tax=Amycolatopsis sp. NBC_01480 TaxID=2903562 RepID=UPI002E27BE2B|nr:ATP-grasp domain-containing protein [Amycolatopsis sp. NBC_01480]